MWLFTWPGWEVEDPSMIFEHEADLRDMYPHLKINTGWAYEGPRIGKTFVSCKPKSIYFEPRNVDEHNPNPRKKLKLEKK